MFHQDTSGLLWHYQMLCCEVTVFVQNNERLYHTHVTFEWVDMLLQYAGWLDTMLCYHFCREGCIFKSAWCRYILHKVQVIYWGKCNPAGKIIHMGVHEIISLIGFYLEQKTTFEIFQEFSCNLRHWKCLEIINNYISTINLVIWLSNYLESHRILNSINMFFLCRFDMCISLPITIMARGC